MTTLFISDLHLDASRPHLTAIFLKLLQNQAKTADALYILGDFFEVWVGDDEHTDFIQSIKAALKSLTASGVPIFIMHGNRDFLLGQQFMHETGCQLLPDPAVIDLYGNKTVLVHGDTLCTDDIQYQRFRVTARNKRYQRIFLGLPLAIRRWIAGRLRSKSQQTDNTIYSDAALTAIEQTFTESNATIMIHGHTHRPSIALAIGEYSYQRFVLADWEKEGNVLIAHPDGTFRLISLL